MTTLTLEKMPATGANYLKAALSLSRKAEGAVAIPSLSATLPELRVDPAQLNAYREICGFAAGETLPITFPQVIAAAIQMHLLNQPGFPIPLIGLVHLRNKIEQQRPLKADESFAVNVRIEGEGSQHSDKGLEFDIVTTFSVGDEELWQCAATVLHRAKKKSEKPSGKKPVAKGDDALHHYESFDAPEDIGRRYGRISGDMNPIHLYPLTARLFGYPKAIAHGMWSLARCAAILEPHLGAAPRRLDCAFKQPLFLPGRVALKHHSVAAGIDFSLLARNSDKVHLVGSLLR
ncbi:MAG TPA: MaoC/PaaZ C-terminal domain-containing protein [Nevskiaceae bacterium]|nr:MaoC/PaaZ C-terminal domain-containing protein [Nevskiaceae bacterium]